MVYLHVVLYSISILCSVDTYCDCTWSRADGLHMSMDVQTNGNCRYFLFLQHFFFLFFFVFLFHLKTSKMLLRKYMCVRWAYCAMAHSACTQFQEARCCARDRSSVNHKRIKMYQSHCDTKSSTMTKLHNHIFRVLIDWSIEESPIWSFVIA